MQKIPLFYACVADGCIVRDVANDTPDPVRSEIPHHIGIHVEPHHGGAVGSQRVAGRAPDAAAGTGNDRDLAAMWRRRAPTPGQLSLLKTPVFDIKYVLLGERLPSAA